MEEEIKITGLVDKVIEDLRKNESTRFSNGDFQSLVYAVLQDKTFNVEKFVVKGDEIVKSTHSVNADMRKFLDKLLKHAGMSKPEERESVIDSFVYGVNDIAWVADAVDEAMWIYTESGKNMRIFRDKMRHLSFKKKARTGKHEGKIGYTKSVADKALMLERKLKPKAAE